MSELDYQMALVLDYQFKQELNPHSDLELARALQEKENNRRPVVHQADVELARALQAQEESPPELSLSHKSVLNSHKCLHDPSWELVDPTPDIHALFIAFDQRFFENKLQAVCVSWSKKMTSCAGVCSYQGRGGMCSITLSEPLLKLRPRKDLVDTLLHEMIHAYLFVTHNNRDRDGHGPEFHKHMYRINQESGTNITVYHSFHDEVRLYQQHWWRCNGPCQTRKPFFGMVRRAMNREPGPSDRWWAEHSQTCGGTFIKVKEPEKPTKTQKKPTKTSMGADIRTFVKSGNVTGFAKTNGSLRGKTNSNSTIVVTKNDNKENRGFQPTVINKNVPETKVPEQTITDEFVMVRNHWANKYPTTSKKRPSESVLKKIPEKMAKPSTSKASEDEVECPVCHEKFATSVLNSHLDECLNKDASVIDLTTKDDQECPICRTSLGPAIFDSHVVDCINSLCDGIEEKLDDKVPCLACGKNIYKASLNTHLDECMNDFKVGGSEKNEDDAIKTEYNCPFCMRLIAEVEMKKHIDNCLDTADVLDSFIDS